MDTVERWIEGLRGTGLEGAELDRRRTLLEEFCALAGSTPDEIVEGCVDRERGAIKVKARKRIEALIDHFAAAGNSDARAAVQRANVIRSFLIHNGVRVLTPRAPWL